MAATKQRESEKCPLCGKAETTLQNTASVDQLVALYKMGHAYDIRPLFPEGTNKIGLYDCPGCGLKFYSPAVSGDEAFYAHLAAQHKWYYRDDKWEFTATRSNIPRNAHVLEIGCGKGAFTTGLTCASYTGLEFSASQLPANDHWRTFLQQSAEEHSKSHAAAYDVVCSFQVLEHVVELRPFVDAMARMLKPGGLLVLSVPCENSFMGIRVNESLNMPPHHLTRWTGAALSSLGKLLGLEMLNLVKEPLQGNAGLAAVSIVAGILRAYTGLPATPLIDLSDRHRGLMESAAAILPQMPELAENLLRGQSQHSYLAAYRKPV